MSFSLGGEPLLYGPAYVEELRHRTPTLFTVAKLAIVDALLQSGEAGLAAYPITERINNEGGLKYVGFLSLLRHVVTRTPVNERVPNKTLPMKPWLQNPALGTLERRGVIDWKHEPVMGDLGGIVTSRRIYHILGNQSQD